MASKSLKRMTNKELETAWTKAAKALETAKEECRAFSEEHQRRADLERAQQAFETMSDSELAALLQIAGAEGINSDESMGEI